MTWDKVSQYLSFQILDNNLLTANTLCHGLFLVKYTEHANCKFRILPSSVLPELSHGLYPFHLKLTKQREKHNTIEIYHVYNTIEVNNDTLQFNIFVYNTIMVNNITLHLKVYYLSLHFHWHWGQLCHISDQSLWLK